MKNILLISALLCVSLSPTLAQESPELNSDSLQLKVAHDKSTLSGFELFMKDRYYGFYLNASYDKHFSFGVGYYLHDYFVSPYRKFPTPSFETNLNYHLDGYLFHNFSILVPLLISPSLSLCTYTNFDKTSVFLRPGIGINAAVVSISYNFNWLSSDALELQSNHHFSLIYRFGIAKNLWKLTGDPLQSQYDRRKLKKKERKARKGKANS